MDQHNIIIEGIHYSSRKVIRIGIRNGFIYSLADIDEIYWSGEGSRDKLPVIAPGLIDLQLNGFKGVDFNNADLTPEQVESVSLALLKLGVTRFYPTLITGSRKRTSSLLRTIAGVIKDKSLASHVIGGIHLEGPFISGEDGPRGAHPKRYCLDPDISLLHQWQQEAEGHIRIITLAPELPGSDAFIKECVQMGIIVAIGHTAANKHDIETAVENGATLSTHLGNATHQLLPRHPNYIWDQLAEDKLYASMIADGFHLPDSVLKVFIRSKMNKSILVSDGMPYTGLEPGLYNSTAAGRIRLTEDGKLHREGNTELLVGSASTLLAGVQKICSMEGLAFAWDMGSVHPSALMNNASNQGLQVGAPADLVLLESDLDELKITRVFKGGVEWVSVR